MTEGIEEGSISVLSGPPEIEKDSFCQELLISRLRKGWSGIYLVSESSPEDVRRKMRDIAGNEEEYEKRGNLKFIDCYSWMVGDKEAIHPRDLPSINIAILKEIEELKGSIVFILDSMSSMLNYVEAESFLKFIQGLTARLKKSKVTALYILHSGVQAETFSRSLKYIVDGTFEFKCKETDGQLRKYVRIFGYREKEKVAVSSWVPFTVTSSGINLGLHETLEKEREGIAPSEKPLKLRVPRKVRSMVLLAVIVICVVATAAFFVSFSGTPMETAETIQIVNFEPAGVESSSDTWVSIYFANIGGRDLEHFELRVTNLPSTMTVAYPGGAGSASLSRDHTLSVNEVDYSKVRLSTSSDYKDPVVIRLEALYVADGEHYITTLNISI